MLTVREHGVLCLEKTEMNPPEAANVTLILSLVSVIVCH